MNNKLKIIIEDSIFYDDNLYELNNFLTICTMCRDRQELNEELKALAEMGGFDHLEEKGLRYGFGHTHFWLSEKQDNNEWVRILFIDFSE
jgi:hypothetical protein